MSRNLVVPVAAVAALFLVACGGTNSTAQATPSPSPSPAASPIVGEGTITVVGIQEKVLTTPGGLTLYFLTSDLAAAPKCAGACLTHWPALTSTGSPVGMAGMSGTLTVVQNPNGSQVAYNGHLLYTFFNDKASGDAKGEGIQAFGGVWHAATPDLTST